MDRLAIAGAFRELQNSICSQLERLDGVAQFGDDPWQRLEGGGGLSRPIANGKLIEKGGVNFSEVFGPLTPQAAKALNVVADEFYATGVSIVLHAHSPWVPTIHMNIRYFETNAGQWFGGGIDLTPAYMDLEVAKHFHKRLKEMCDRWDPDFYQRFKPWADDYFFLPHRNETRGIGGIFFDRLMADADHRMEDLFGFTCDVGELFAPLYAEVVSPTRDRAFGAPEKKWQLLRRGRYVEFNLVHDRGTKFGLDTGGRTESILMSLPAEASWRYDHHPEPGSLEAETIAWLRKGIDWIHP